METTKRELMEACMENLLAAGPSHVYKFFDENEWALRQLPVSTTVTIWFSYKYIIVKKIVKKCNYEQDIEKSAVRVHHEKRVCTGKKRFK